MPNFFRPYQTVPDIPGLSPEKILMVKREPGCFGGLRDSISRLTREDWIMVDDARGRTPDRLLQFGANRLADELDSLLADPGTLSDSIAHALAEGAGFRAMSALQQGDSKDALLWANTALKLYGSLAERSSRVAQAPKGEQYLDSAMILRSALIGRFGARSGDAVLDANALRDWFLKGLNLELAVARKMASDWKNLPVQEIQKLRNIKNRLKILRPALGVDPIGNDLEIQAWAGLEKELP